MSKFLAKLPSPRVLSIFEAAARLGSFTRAADELHMQQPSVSAAIRQLEELLGEKLFYRSHRRVELTDAGQRLYPDISRGLADLDNALSRVRQMGTKGYVTLSSSSAFSHYWMMPRLARLRAAHPEVDLRMQISNREPDLDIESINLAVRLGEGSWSDCHFVRIADEVIFPVANPTVMASASLSNIADLILERLIHLEEPIRERVSWNEWFAFHGLTARHDEGGLRLNDYAMVLQAAVAGEGFAFGWEHVVATLLDSNLLMARTDWSWRTGRGIYLVWSKTKPLSASAEIVRKWIIEVADYPS